MVSARKKSQLAGTVGAFIQQYARKAQKGWDPNDRGYDRQIEALIKRLPAEELSELISGDAHSWQPISKHELEQLVSQQLQNCTAAQGEFFASHRVPLYEVPIIRSGSTESVFVVAQFEQGILYYEDVEEGFELATLNDDGAIAAAGRNQYDLSQALDLLGR